MTYAELAVRIGTMTTEQLAMSVIWCGDEIGGKITSVLILDEEHVNVGDGMEPASTIGPEDCGDVIARWAAGTPLLMADEPT